MLKDAGYSSFFDTIRIENAYQLVMQDFPPDTSGA